MKHLLLILFLLVTSAFVCPPRAGTLIGNGVLVTYTDASGVRIEVISQNITVVVLPLEALLLQQTQTVFRPPNSFVHFTHTLTNTGNARTTYDLSLTAGTVNLIGLQILLDVTPMGVPTAGEQVVRSVTLECGESVSLLVAGIITETSDGVTGSVDLVASGPQGASATNRDTVQISTTLPVMVVRKSATTSTAVQGNDLTYILRADNISLLSAVGMAVTVDLVNQTLVIFRDTLPAQTTFSAVVPPERGTALYHLLGTTDPHAYVTTIPSGATVDAVALGLEIFGPLEFVEFTFNARVASTANGSITNTCVLYQDLPPPNDQTNCNLLIIPLFQTADLTITKDDGLTEAIQRTDVTYTTTVTNNGPGCWGNIQICMEG